MKITPQATTVLQIGQAQTLGFRFAIISRVEGSILELRDSIQKHNDDITALVFEGRPENDITPTRNATPFGASTTKTETLFSPNNQTKYSTQNNMPIQVELHPLTHEDDNHGN